MRIIRYQDASGKIHHAAEEGSAYFQIEGDLFGSYRVAREPAKIGAMLAPVAPPTIWCIGQNYRRHADEVGMSSGDFPVVFAKGVNTVQGPDAPIALPIRAESSEIDYEGELVAIIGRACKDVSRERALDYVLGYTCGNDVSSRDWQLKKGGTQWCRGKSFDTFAPMGPCLVTADEIRNPSGLHIQTRVNGRLEQDASTSDMVRDVPTLIEFLSQSTTLLPGTAIFTGTPHGVGMAQNPPLWLKEGDEVSVTIEKIGTLSNRVRGTAEKHRESVGHAG
jgi:2-keto-4-pentenoate hydratase/2-oxohepta-3-ene-1,7-dioic acid hydratase in catechol pathway